VDNHYYQLETLMAVAVFDTLKFVRTLRDAGIEEKQAEAFSRAFQGVWTESDIATKTELRETNRQVDNKFDVLRNEIGILHNEIKTMGDRMDTRFDAMNGKIDTIKWVGLLLAIIFIAPTLKTLVG